jgi:hypothetical protein
MARNSAGPALAATKCKAQKIVTGKSDGQSFRPPNSHPQVWSLFHDHSLTAPASNDEAGQRARPFCVEANSAFEADHPAGQGMQALPAFSNGGHYDSDS